LTKTTKTPLWAMNRWAAGAAVPTDAGSTAPKAFLQYILFNKNMSMAQHGHHMVSEEAGSSWQHLQLRVPIEEIGYIYIYVINESMDGVDVYFDDALVRRSGSVGGEVQLIDAPLTSASYYYPYGLPISYRSHSSEHYRYGYQGQFAEKDEETGWNAFELRMYEPVIGRWITVDPERQHPSPYVGMGNRPTGLIDPDGGQDGDRKYFVASLFVMAVVDYNKKEAELTYKKQMGFFGNDAQRGFEVPDAAGTPFPITQSGNGYLTVALNGREMEVWIEWDPVGGDISATDFQLGSGQRMKGVGGLYIKNKEGGILGKIRFFSEADYEHWNQANQEIYHHYLMEMFENSTAKDLEYTKQRNLEYYGTKPRSTEFDLTFPNKK
jgi:RHS repeat-associated protein